MKVGPDFVESLLVLGRIAEEINVEYKDGDEKLILWAISPARTWVVQTSVGFEGQPHSFKLTMDIAKKLKGLTEMEITIKDGFVTIDGGDMSITFPEISVDVYPDFLRVTTNDFLVPEDVDANVIVIRGIPTDFVEPENITISVSSGKIEETYEYHSAIIKKRLPLPEVNVDSEISFSLTNEFGQFVSALPGGRIDILLVPGKYASIRSAETSENGEDDTRNCGKYKGVFAFTV